MTGGRYGDVARRMDYTCFSGFLGISIQVKSIIRVLQRLLLYESRISGEFLGELQRAIFQASQLL